MDKKKENISKEAIVAEYLTGSISYRGLETKYGIPSRTICDWVLGFQGRKPSWKDKKQRNLEIKGKELEPELPKYVVDPEKAYNVLITNIKMRIIYFKEHAYIAR